MSEIRYVAQPNGYGCAIACVAMIVGETYDQMERWFIDQGLSRERMERGCHEGIWTEALARHGFVIARLWRHDAIAGRDREPWPPAPFAPVHLCTAAVAAGSHAIVMLADGAVLDPFKRERTTITHPDYHQIHQVVGVWRRPT